MLERVIENRKFDRKNLPNDFYVYLYLRDNESPYYVGKGIGVRAWVKHLRKNGTELRPEDQNRIKIVAHKLSEYEAYLLENKLIHQFGFKFDGGILVNLKFNEFSDNDLSVEYREELKKIHNSESVIENHRLAAYRMWSDESIRMNLISGIDKKKRSTDSKNNWKDPNIREKRINGILQYTSTDEYKTMRANRVGVKANRADKTVYNFININGTKEKCTRIELCHKYNLKSKFIGRVTRGERRSHKGWKLDV